MPRSANRRQFLKTAAAISAGYWVAGGVARARPAARPTRSSTSASSAWPARGGSNLGGVSGENIVALCDIDENNLAGAAKRFPKAKTYVDWRKAVEQKDLDAVVVSTADQVHALASNWAMQRGLSVYCEKPLAHSVHEARTDPRDLPGQQGQAGHADGHADPRRRQLPPRGRAGAVGRDRPGPRGPRLVRPHRARAAACPRAKSPCPSTSTGTSGWAPPRSGPTTTQYLPGNLTWNRWWDFGNGTLGDMGSHVIDLAFWALKLRHPTTRRGQGRSHARLALHQRPLDGHHLGASRPCGEPTARPGEAHLVRRHPAAAVAGGPGPEEVGPGRAVRRRQAACCVADYGRYVLLPEDKFKDFKPPKPSIPPSRGHHQEWIHACKTGEPTLCNFDYSGLLIENNLLGNVAYRVGKKLEWDPKALKAVNCPEADQFIRRKYREGWTLEG